MEGGMRTGGVFASRHESAHRVDRGPLVEKVFPKNKRNARAT
jgi:hypothetical protein